MPVSFELLPAMFGLATAFVSAAGTFFSLWRFWVHKLHTQLERKDEEVRWLKDELQSARQDVENLRRECRELQGHLRVVQRSLDTARGRAAGWRQQLDHLRRQVEQKAALARKVAAIARKYKQAAAESDSKCAALHRHLAEQASWHQTQLDDLRQSKDEEWGALLEQERGQRIAEVAALTRDVNSLRRQLDEKIAEAESYLRKIQELDDKLTEHESTRQRIRKHKGRIWEQSVPATAAPFVPLAERNATIISVLNLKGGVGKTTLTANIAAALGYPDNNVRSLVIDLDYQRSLTQLCCRPSQIKKLHNDGKCIQHFLLHPARRVPGGNGEAVALDGSNWVPALHRVLLNSTAEVTYLDRDLFRIIACSEDWKDDTVAGTLDDTESHLLAQWVVEGTDGPDHRFRLREALHSDPVQKEFDYVLLDCPPRLSLACINALAASDFVLIPVILDGTSAISVPLLLQKLRRLRRVQGLVPSLRVLGVVANKVAYFNKQPLEHMRKVLKRLPNLCAEAWGEPVHLFASMIPERAAFGRSAGGLEPKLPAASNAEIRGIFNNLIHEMEARIDHERQILATVS